MKPFQFKINRTPQNIIGPIAQLVQGEEIYYYFLVTPLSLSRNLEMTIMTSFWGKEKSRGLE